MMTEKVTNIEYYGREILEAILYANAYPVRKTKLLEAFNKMIAELAEVLDKDSLNEYQEAKKVVQETPEDKIEKLCRTVKNLYGDSLDL